MKAISMEDLDHVLKYTQSLWSAAKGQDLLITGGTGFIGKWILETFSHCNKHLGLNATATVVTRDQVGFLKSAPHFIGKKEIKFIEGDVRTFELGDACPRFIVHGATSVEKVISPDETASVVVDGTRHLLKLAKSIGAQRFLNISSGAIYGPQPLELAAIPEEYVGNIPVESPKHAYGRAKIEAEHLCFNEWKNGGPEPVVGRGFAFIGPYLPLNGNLAAGNFIRDSLARKPIIVEGDGMTIRTYLYAADLAIWIWTMLFASQPGKVYNVGSEIPVSIKELALMVNQASGGQNPIVIKRQNVDGGKISRYVPCTQLAKRDLNLIQRINLNDAITRTVNWYRQKM